jgi:hypothetical protein
MLSESGTLKLSEAPQSQASKLRPSAWSDLDNGSDLLTVEEAIFDLAAEMENANAAAVYFARRAPLTVPPPPPP